MFLTKSRIYEFRLFTSLKKDIKFIWDSAEQGMIATAVTNHKKQIAYYIKKGCQCWVYSLKIATENGHIDLVDYLITRIPYFKKHRTWAMSKGINKGVSIYLLMIASGPYMKINWNLK